MQEPCCTYYKNRLCAIPNWGKLVLTINLVIGVALTTIGAIALVQLDSSSLLSGVGYGGAVAMIVLGTLYMASTLQYLLFALYQASQKRAIQKIGDPRKRLNEHLKFYFNNPRNVLFQTERERRFL